MERSNRATVERLADVRVSGLPPTSPIASRRPVPSSRSRTGSKLAAWPRRTRPGDDRPELLIKLQERKERHKQRNIFQRIAVVILGVLVVIAGIIMSGPGVPGPGIVTILLGLGFLALEFDWAERWMERVIIWGDRAADRAERTTTKTARARRDRRGARRRRVRDGGDPLGHPADARPLTSRGSTPLGLAG